MSDLIDLSSPEDKRLRPALPSPLIPSPATDTPQPSSGLNISDSRRSLDNNPFDMVLRKTSEYVSKSSDPFEIVFEKATSKRLSDPLKLNKTLDESQLNITHMVANDPSDHVPSILVEPASPGNLSILNVSAMNDSFRTFSDRFSLSGTPGALEKSILDNSAMNDTLSISDGSSDDCFLKSFIAHRVSMCIKKGTLEAELDDTRSKGHKLRRSFSQGDKLSPRKIRKRSTSIIGGRKDSDYSMTSILFEDPLNLAFVATGKDNYSSVSDYSELSSITRINSGASGGSFYSGKSSNDSANRGFIESSGVSGSRGSEEGFGELISRFKSWKMKSSVGEDGAGIRGASVGEDDVFLEDQGDKKLGIFSQANILARTFGELAETSTRGSSSSGDLLSTRLPSDFQLSPETSTSCPTLTERSTTHVRSHSPPETSSRNSSNSSKTSPEKKREAAANLLRDLQTVVETEQNPEVRKLLKDLEAALGVESHEHSNSTQQKAKSPLKIPKQESPRKKTIKPSIKNKRMTEESPETSQHMPPRDKTAKYSNKEKTMAEESPEGPKQETPSKKTAKSSNKNKKMVKDQSEDLQNAPEEKSHPSVSKINEKSQEVGDTFQEPSQVAEKSESSREAITVEDSEESDKSSSMNQESEASTEDNTESGLDPQLESANNLNVNFIGKSSSKEVPEFATQQSFTTQKLILDIQLALGKLLEDCKDEPALVLENLNKVLTPKLERRPISPRKSNLPSRGLKSLDHHSPESQNLSQKASWKGLPSRPRSSMSHAGDNSWGSVSKGLISPRKYRRNTSDPGLVDVTVEKTVEVNVKIKSTLPVGDKAKLKKKNDPVGTKKGPMKALVPLGNMQRPGARGAPGTPPKRHKASSPMKIATSTPDPSPIVLGKKGKVKPVASSTPDVASKDRSSRSHIPQSPRKNINWNISPVTPNSKGSASGVFAETDVVQTPKKVEKGLKSSSPVIAGLTKVKERIIRGRRSEPVRGSPKTEEKGGDNCGSPLKENNVIKTKPLNLTPKFRRRSGSLGSIEKENKFLNHKV
ncbi:uncharacterized protein LOC135168478 [Diachasmimorpha longicaudata]|uniref:uncharacterized protein LOC135168478 n=1 Tax=Diachasmimorpha longicaudata TaxID=58733 RepID=UPI0030B8C057